MLIREATQILKSVKLSQSKKVSLLCSFEPLNLKIYTQVFLAHRFPDNTPEVITFGYDQLDAALIQTASVLKTAPALLFVSWEDLHPNLSWRSRGELGYVQEGELVQQGQQLQRKLTEWLAARNGAETYLAFSPVDWLPLHDACPAQALGQAALAAVAVMGELAKRLSSLGGRVLKLPSFPVNYRDLLQSGSPLSLDASEAVATTFVHLAFPEQERKKALVTDLDGTLWKGVIGEDGSVGIRCGQDGIGWPHHVFQKFLMKLKGEGILLAFCSKNNPEDVLPWFDSLNMPLKLADFAAYRCNWESKSGNILSLAQELNISSEAVVVIDDNEAELADVGHRVPGVTVFRTPREGCEWTKLFSQLQDLFGTWQVREEDRLRTNSLASELRRKVFYPSGNQDSASLPHGLDHLRDLQLEIAINRRAFPDPRTLELINKTNQFNLTGERISQEEWLHWGARPGTFCLSAKLKDRFGDFGTICVVTGCRNAEEPIMRVRQFALSCRAFGRGVEHIVLGELVKEASCEWLGGPFKRTAKNEPVQMFLVRLGCQITPEGEWRLSREVVEQSVARTLAETAARVVSA